MFSPARQVNQIFCYICFVITYSPAHMQAIKHRGLQKWVPGPLERTCATSNNVGWFSAQCLLSFFTLLSCHQQNTHRFALTTNIHREAGFWPWCLSHWACMILKKGLKISAQTLCDLFFGVQTQPFGSRDRKDLDCGHTALLREWKALPGPLFLTSKRVQYSTWFLNFSLLYVLLCQTFYLAAHKGCQLFSQLMD